MSESFSGECHLTWWWLFWKRRTASFTDDPIDSIADDVISTHHCHIILPLRSNQQTRGGRGSRVATGCCTLQAPSCGAVWGSVWT